MKNGSRIVDIDTHVQPAMEVLQRYAGAELNERWGELKPYFRELPPRPDVGDYEHPTTDLSVAPYRYAREFGQPAEAETQVAGGKSALTGRVVAVNVEGPGIGIMHDNSAGRLKAMDREGVDVHVIISGTFAAASTALDPSLSREIVAAYNRYIIDYCSADPTRLKAAMIVTGADPEWSARTIRKQAGEQCFAAVNLLLPQDLPIDDPALEPILSAMNEENLGILHHSFFYEPPYFPGYRDVWDNVVVARSAAHPWGAQRLVAYLVLAGLFDRYPNLRIGFAEVGAGWLPFWMKRLRAQEEYMRAAVPDLKHDPVEYAQLGHIFSGLELYEGEDILRGIVSVLGDGVAMYQSDFPHPQCNFPNSPDDALSWDWDTIAEGDKTKKRFFSENAENFLRMT